MNRLQTLQTAARVARRLWIPPPTVRTLRGTATAWSHTATPVRCFSTEAPRNSDDESDTEELGPMLDFSDERFPAPPEIAPKTQTIDNLEPNHDLEPTTSTTTKIATSKLENDPAASANKNNNNNTKTTNDDTASPPTKLIPKELMERIEKQEWQGARMKSAQHGVLHEDPKIDMRLLMENYSVASLASALRDREDALQHCALLAEEKDFDTLAKVLQAFHPRYVIQRRKRRRTLDVCRRLDAGSLEVIRKALMRMPRTVTTAHRKRAGVVIPLCLVDGVPSLLLEKRSKHLRAHPDEVCLPGGMVCNINDTTIVSTCLREMQEEIPGLDMSIVQVLGILRCNWGEVHHLVGVAVTPVVCYLGEVPAELEHNADEVAKVFTIPLSKLLESSLWVQKEDLAPIFVGGPEIIWGLTGYILERFVKDIILPNHIRKDHHLHHHSLKAI